MGNVFQGFGGHGEGVGAEQGAGADGPTQGQHSDAPVPAAPADAPRGDEKPTPASAPEIVPGVPLFTFDNPYGDTGISWLADLDLDATHEAGQPRQHPETDVAPARDLVRSGGSAYYFNAVTGRGFSVPINPEVSS